MVNNGRWQFTLLLLNFIIFFLCQNCEFVKHIFRQEPSKYGNIYSTVAIVLIIDGNIYSTLAIALSSDGTIS